MNWLEQEVERSQRRVTKIGANPDPTKAQSNKMLYELERDLRQAQVDAWRGGKACLTAVAGLIDPLLISLGLRPLNYIESADKLMIADQYMDAAVAEGFPEKSCDRTIALFGMIAKNDLPAPGFVVATNTACDPIYYSGTALAHRFNVPFYTIDVPLEENEGTLKYVAEQLSEMVDMVQATVPGTKFDEDKLRYLQGLNGQAVGYLREMYQMRKKHPCPVPTLDIFRLPRLPASLPDPERGLEYFRAYLGELKARAAELALADEKLRVMWTCSAPYFANPFDILEKKGARIVVFQFDMVGRLMAGTGPLYGEEQYGRKLSPIEEEARMLLLSSWVGKGTLWLDEVLYICKDLEVEAIVNFNQVGCMATAGLGKIIAERAEAELGIPTLNIEGRQLAAQDYNRVAFEAALEQFLDICLTRQNPKPA